MQTTMALRAVVPRAEAGWRAGAARRMSVVRGAGAPPFRAASAASPARQVVARDGMAPLESYADAPPLEVVPWSKETANTVNLTGTVGQLDVRRLASGKTKAQIRLAVRKPATDQDQESDWCAPQPARASCTCSLAAAPALRTTAAAAAAALRQVSC